AGDHQRAGEPEREARGDPASTPGDSARGRGHDADDEGGREDLAEYDDRSAEHGYFATITPLAVFSLNSPTNLYSPGLSGPMLIVALDLPGITFSTLSGWLSNSSGVASL